MRDPIWSGSQHIRHESGDSPPLKRQTLEQPPDVPYSIASPLEHLELVVQTIHKAAVSGFTAAAQTAQTSVSRLTAYASSQQTAASHEPALARRCRVLRRQDQQRCGQHQVEVRDIDVRLVPADQRDSIGSHTDIAWVEVAVDDTFLTPDELRP